MRRSRCDPPCFRVTLALLLIGWGTAHGQDEAPLLPPPVEAPSASPPAAPPATGVEQAVDQAHTLMLLDRLDEARALLEAVLKGNPAHAQAWHWLGLVELKLQHPAEGIAALERGMHLAPLDPVLQFDLAAAYEAENRPMEAERVYQGMLGDDAVGIEASLRLGRLYAMTDRVDLAIDTFEKAQAKDAARARDAVAQLDGLYTRKAQALMAALELGEDDAFTRAMTFGVALVSKQRLEDARRIFETVIKTSPQQAPGYYWLSRVQITRGELAEGLKNLERSAQLAPDNFRLKLELGKAYDAAERRSEAERTFKDIIDHAQDPALLKEVRRLYGLLRAGKLLQAREWAAALAIFEGLLIEDAGDARLLELKAQALEELGRHGETDPILTALLERFPNDVMLRSRVAGIYERRGDGVHANEQYARILQLQPKGEPARLALDRLGLNRGSELLQKNLPEEALRIFQSVLAIAPETPAANLGAGIAYHRLQRNAEAVAALTKVLAADPNNMVAQIELAQIYEATGRTEEASRAFEDLERFVRTGEERKFLRDRLGALYTRESNRILEAYINGAASDTAGVVSLVKRLVKRGFNEEAVKSLTTALERAPNDPQLHYWLGKAHLGMGQSDRGLAELERSTRLAPDNYPAMLELADDYARAGRGEDAERTLLEIIRSSGDEGLKRQAARSLAMIRIGRLLQDKNYAGALAEYDKLLREFPDDLQLMSDRGRVLVALDRKAEAEQVFARLLELAPDNVNIRLGIAQIYRMQNQPERAETIYTELLEHFPGLVAARFERGRLYQETGRDFDALKDYGLLLQQLKDTEQGKQALALLDGLTRQLLERGIGLINAKKLDEALSLFTQMADIQPNNVQIRYLLSQVYKEQGRFDLQVQALEKVAEGQPNNIAMKRRIAFAYIDAGNAAKASEILHEVLAAFPYDSEVRLALGDLLERGGQHPSALKEYITLLELNPAEEWRAKTLDRLGLEKARTQAARGEVTQAIATVKEVLAIAPDDPLAVKALASIYHRAGRLEQAETAWRRVLAASPDDRDARLSLAGIYVVTGREGDAIKAYHSLASEEALTSQRDDARKGLDKLLLHRAERIIEHAGEARTAEAVKEDLLPVGIESFDLGGFDAAQKIFDYVIKQFPDSAESLYWLGRVYAERKQFSDALVFMKRSVDLEPQEPRFLLGLGQAYQDMDIFGPAEQTLEKARDLAPNNIEIRFALAALYQRRGDGASAEAQYAHALEHAADEAALRRALDGLGLPVDPEQLSEAEQHKALRVFGSMISDSPRTIAAKYYIAVVYQLRKRYADAEAGYQSVLSQNEAHAGANLHLARLYSETGRADQATALLEKVVGDGGDPRVLQEAQKQLIGLIVSRAQNLTDLMRRGEGDVREAKRLCKQLLVRGEADIAAAMMEAAAQVAPNDAEAQYLLGRANVDRGEFAAGIASLERSVKLSPAALQTTLRQHLAIAYEKAGRLDEAVAIHRDLYRRAPDELLRRQASLRLAMARAKQLIKAGDNSAALREYDAALELFPNEVLLLIERGELLARMGRNDQADRTFERVLELAPKNQSVRLRLAETYNAHGDKAKMVPQAAAIIEIDPFSPEAQQARLMLAYDKGIELLKSGSLEDAQETFERILTVLPKDPITRFDLGRTYFQQRKYAEAEQVLGEIIRDYPDNQEAHFLLGNIFQNLERREGAIAEYERAVALGRQTITGQLALKGLEEMYSQRVKEQMDAGQDDAAILGLVTQVQSAPDNVAARANLVVLYTRKQRYDKALQQLREMARLQPTNPAVYSQMASIFAVTQRNAQSTEAYAYAISLETNEETVNRYLRELVISMSRYLLEEGKSFAAIRELQMLNDMDLGDERVNFILGVIYRQQNRYEEAARAFRDAVRAKPDNVVMRYNLAELYERTSDYDLALLQYRQILRVGKPGDRIVEAARPRADALKNRLALFSSQLQYGMTIGDSNVEEQDIAATGAINSSFSSSLVYNLGTNFWPTNNLNLRLDTGVILVTNHSTQTDTFVPRIGLAGNLNYSDSFYSASAMVSDIRNLMAETTSGRTFNYNVSAGLRLRDTLGIFRGWGKKKTVETGETSVERVPEPRAVTRPAAPEIVGDNARLRGALQEVYRRLYPTFTVTQAVAPVSTYTVARGDTLWSISTQFNQDPFMWRELNQLNPQILNPDRIYPGELIYLEPPQAASLFQEFDTARMLERDEHIRKSVEAVMDQYETGQTLMRQGSLDEALKRFKLVLDIVPDDPLTLLNVGRVYQRQREYTLAEHAYLAFAANPENQQIRLRLADLYEESGQLDQAIRMDEEALRHTLTELERAAANAQLRKLYQRKADMLLEKQDLSDDDVAAMLEISAKLLNLPAITAAQGVLERLLTRRPDDVEGNLRLAQIYLQLDKPQQAVAHASNSVKGAPEDERSLLALARAARAVGDYDRAEAICRTLIEKGGDEASAGAARHELELTLAERLQAERKPRQAHEAYVRLVDERPEEVSLLVAAARIAYGLGLLDEAADGYAHAIAIDPGVLGYRLELTDIYRRLEQKDKAREQLVAALGIAENQDHRRAILDHLGFQEALAEMRRDKPDKALNILRDIESLVPDNALVQLNIGVAYQMQEKYPEAEAQFQRILDSDPGNLNALLRLGMVYAETGKVDRAITVYEKVISDSKGLTVGERARAELQGLEQRRLRVLTGSGIERSEPLVKTLRGRLFSSNSVLPGRSVTQVDAWGAGASFTYPTAEYGSWAFNYTFNLRDNVDPLGTDYAFYSHELGLTWQTPMPNIGRWLGPWFGAAEYVPGLTASLDLDHEMRYYQYFDTSFLNINGQAQRRRQTVSTLTAGLSYRFPNIDQMSLYFNYTRGRTRADLPVGIIFSPEGVPVSFQSSGLGNFDPNYAAMGFTFQF